MIHQLLVATMLFFILPPCSGLQTGFNQAWLKTDYGSSFLDSHYSAEEAERILKLTAYAHGKVMRMWLLEGLDLQQIEWDGSTGRPLRLKSEFLKNFEHFLLLSKKYNIQTYVTLFDGNSLRIDPRSSAAKRFKFLLNNQDQFRTDFIRYVMPPLFALLKKHQDAIYAIDICNEIDALVDYKVYPHGFDRGWAGANQFIVDFRNALRQTVSLPVTASLSFWKPEQRVLKQEIAKSNVDFYDIHIYRNDGKIENCQELRKFSLSNQRPIVLGEFGQTPFPFDYNDDWQTKSTQNFLVNSERCGFQAALAWRLSDIRPGYNREARFSFEAFGKMRPAFWVFREYSKP